MLSILPEMAQACRTPVSGAGLELQQPPSYSSCELSMTQLHLEAAGASRESTVGKAVPEQESI